MTSGPPSTAERLLAWALRDDPAAPAILGDLYEDHGTRLGTIGATRARWWYHREVAADGAAGRR